MHVNINAAPVTWERLMLESPDYFYPEIRESLAQNRGVLVKNVEEIDQKS
jgi:hypothetical protein